MSCLTLTTWHKSTYSNDTYSACVEVLLTGAGVAVRDSKDHTRVPLTLGPCAWGAFVASA
ncbi:DUF397 domain-containing protein, partial [Streptomyces sp. NPDC005900]|uniref:DUF397 domain-containing protein n=1 Tax=Streptomyces sp. NPDC005900 TaxID=3154569 RepID=UPI0033E46311